MRPPIGARMRVNSTSSARCRTRAWAAASAARAVCTCGRQPVDVRSAKRLPLRAGAGRGRGSAAASARSLCAVATPARASASDAANGRGSIGEEQLALPDDLAVGEVDADDLARDARAHLDAAARLEPADIIVPLVDLALRGVPRPSPWGVGGAAAGDGSLLQKVTAAASGDEWRPVDGGALPARTVGDLHAQALSFAVDGRPWRSCSCGNPSRSAEGRVDAAGHQLILVRREAGGEEVARRLRPGR